MAQCLFLVKASLPKDVGFQNKKVEGGSKPGSLIIELNTVVKNLAEKGNGTEVVVCRVLPLLLSTTISGI